MRLPIALLFAIVASAPPAFAADSYCKRVPLDPEFPAGLAGSYEVIGKHSDGPAYSGTLTLGFGRSRYRVVQTVQGRPTYGTAWFSECGADKIRTLTVRLESKPAIEMRCTIGGDGDNYYRVTCKSSKGIEAWFQRE